MTKHLTEIEPYAVRAREAGRRGGHGRTKTFALVKSGEYDAYLDGGVLMITTESIRRRIRRKLEESAAAVKARRIEACERKAAVTA